MNDVTRFIVRRIPLMLVSLWLLITVTFLLVALTLSDRHGPSPAPTPRKPISPRWRNG